jgi:hypothetical protein
MTTRKLRFSLLALAATATLATTALTPSTASAWGRGGGDHFGGRVLGLHTGVNHYRFGWGYNHYRFGWGYNHYRFGWRYPGCWFGRCYPYRWYGWHRWFPRPIVYGGLGAVGGAAVTAAPAISAPVAAQPTRPTNCLVKQYLPNGAVAFADTCTNEQAVAMPNAGQGQPGPGAQ